MLRSIVLLGLLLLAFASIAEGGANDCAAILVSTGAWTKTVACATLATQNCNGLTPVSQTPVGANNYIAVYAGRGPVPLQVNGVDFGIQYNSSAVVVASWNKCGDLDLPTATWPASGSGISEIWGSPQTGMNVLLLGWFRVTTYAGYGPMTFCAGDHPQNPARLLDLSSNFDDLRGPACGSWDGSPGGNPYCDCWEIPVESSSWGRIKSQYAQ